jgi:ATP-binding cassette subfamily B protein
MEKIPDLLKDKIKKDFPADKILIAISSDITSIGAFGEEWLVITDKNLLVFSIDKDGVNTLFNFNLSLINSIENVDLIESGCVEIEVGGSNYRIILYSNAKRVDFCNFVEVAKEILKGNKNLDGIKLKEKNLCKICLKPIPEGMSRCPRCVDRRRTFLRIMNFSKPYTKLILMILLTMGIGSGFGLVTPYISKLLIDFILKQDPITKVYNYAGWLTLACLGLFLAYVGQLFFGGLQERLSGSLGYKTVYDVRALSYEKLQQLSLSYFDKHQTGAILARINQDTGELQRFLVDFIPLTLEAVFMLIGVGIFLFILSWQLTLYILLPVIATVLFLKKIFPRVWSYFHKYYHKRAVLSALVNDSLTGIRVIKAFGQESLEVNKFNKKSSDYKDAGIELVKQWSIYHPILHLFIMCGVTLVWYIGGKLVFLGKMSVGSVVAYSGYLMMFYRPVFTLTRMVEMITNSLSAAERVFDIIDTEPEIKDSPTPISMPNIKGGIEFRNVTFGYNRFKPVLFNINLKIEPNEMIGLVGKTGAGKTTIVNLICRLYDVNEGEVLIDNVNVKDIKQSDLRNQIGMVLQEPFLFSGSIYENIAYAKPHATKEEIIMASIAANAHEFIIKKPDGYDTDVGERGNNLSGGEKQMISIARAILRNPKILILDEATSSVDVQTEKKIQDALARLVKNRTTIAIAHRLSTLYNCDRLIVIEEGRIVEVGTHEELMNKKGVFYNLIKTQEEYTKQMLKYDLMEK